MVVEHLCDVHHALCLVLPVQSAGNMHQAARIGGHQRGSFRPFQVAYLSLQEFRRKLCMLDREDTPEAAAVLCLGQLADLSPFYR